MATMKLVVVDEDSYFIEMLSAYVRRSEFGQLLTLSTFTSRETAFSFIEQSVEPYILLVHENLMPLPDQVFRQQLGCLILLSDTVVAVDILEYPVLCKFQPLNQLLSHLISHYNEYTSSRQLRGNRTTKVVSIYSAVGGSGKTLTAVHLARELALRGSKVFYLNLEQLPSISWMEPTIPEEENGLARILYYGKKDPKLQIARLERHKRIHSVMGFDYLPGGHEPNEVMDMSEHDTETLIQSLVSTGAYDVILLDLDSSLYPRTRASFEQTDVLIWIALDERIHLEKTAMQLKLWEKQIQVHNKKQTKVQLVLNKFNGSLTNAASQWPLPIAGYLPYVPEWKAYSTVEQIQPRGSFSESLAALRWIST